MQGPSRAAAVHSREAFAGVLAAGADPARLAQELFAVVGVLDGSLTLRRAVVDPSREGADRAALVGGLFGGKVAPSTLEMLESVVSQRWSFERDLSDTIESCGIEAVIASAEMDNRADRVEDELFRFERIVAADPELQMALTQADAPTEKRADLADSLLRGKVAEETLALVRQAVIAPRGRRFDATIETYLDIASTRRQMQTATVTSAMPLTDADTSRLVTALASIYGGKIHLNAVVDPRVIGGIRVEIGDEVIDGTILRKLEGARRAMDA
ncbi:MAG: F0F1 ATP synthase subunit delta [Micrococcales bacterium]|nr:F0F1 ATP synthase subunit delta [Micrococcales bacterium]